MREHVHAETFSASAAQLFDLLIRPSAICGWWGAARAIVIPQVGGVWAAAWGDLVDEPDYVTVARISELDPPNRLTLCDYRYHAKSGPLPFEAEFTTTFEVLANDTDCELKVYQSGFPTESSADAYYEACQQGWKATFQGIRDWLTSADSN